MSEINDWKRRLRDKTAAQRERKLTQDSKSHNLLFILSIPLDMK